MATGCADARGTYELRRHMDRQASADLGWEHTAQRSRIRSNRKPLVVTAPAPLTGRASLTAAWTGRSMILLGGAILNQQSKVFSEGASFTPTVR